MIEYRKMLKEELESRRRREGTSLRKFADIVKVTPGHLSLVMNGKRNLSYHKSLQIAESLGWEEGLKKTFTDSVMAEQPGANLSVSPYKKSKEPLSSIDRDVFTAISQWYHSAILNLVDMEDFSNDPEIFSKRLRISLLEASNALDRLIRHKFLLVNKNGILEVCMDDNKRLVKSTPSKYIRRFHKQMLEKGLCAIEEQDYAKRVIGGITFAANPEKLKKAETMIMEFCQSLTTEMQVGEKSSIYHLGSVLFRVDQED